VEADESRGVLGVVAAEDDDEGDSRESVIKAHYMARIQDLASQLQVADGKSLHFYTDSCTFQVG
jgi:protein phosphatase 1 regulatory subunit 21